MLLELAKKAQAEPKPVVLNPRLSSAPLGLLRCLDIHSPSPAPVGQAGLGVGWPEIVSDINRGHPNRTGI